MANPYYARLPEARITGAELDVAPLGNALAQLQKSNEFQQRQRLDEERLGLQRQQADQSRETHEADMRTRTVKEIAGVAQMVEQEQDPGRRAGLWGKLQANYPQLTSALQEHGIDPNDHVTGPKFLIAQATGYRNPLDDQAKQAQIDTTKAHGRYYDAAAGAAQTRATAATDNAATRRLKTFNEMLVQFGDNPTEQQWEANSGIINAAFGRPIPYSDRGTVLAQMRTEVNQQFEPTEEDRIAGITREDKVKAFRQQRINEMHGVKDSDLIKKGVRMTPGGAFEPIPGDKASEADKQRQIMARASLQNLDNAEKILTSGNMLTNAFAEKTGIGERGQAYNDYQGSVLQMVYALSGKQTTNKEMERFLQMYMPTYGDSEKRIRDKTARIRGFMNAALSTVRDPGEYDAVEAALLQKFGNSKWKPDEAQRPKKDDKAPADGWSIRKLQ